MSYWMHRVEKHYSGLDILFQEKRLTIGFSDCAKDDSFFEAFSKSQQDEQYRNGAYGKDFDDLYWEVYGGDIWRLRWSLWYFIHDMSAEDLVVVPYSGGFCICKLKGEALRSERRDTVDIGWEWEVEILADCNPRDGYASTSLLSRMKCQQLTLCLDALKDDVELALSKYRENKPYCFEEELARKCHDILDEFGTPDEFERLVKNYFVRLGGQADVLSKNYSGKDGSGKVGDCDVSALFPALRLNILVQCKKHWGKTNEWSVRQITDFAKAETESEGWSYVKWVVSFADDFTDEAKELAKKEGVILISGNEFCRMLVTSGVGE